MNHRVRGLVLGVAAKVNVYQLMALSLALGVVILEIAGGGGGGGTL